MRNVDHLEPEYKELYLILCLEIGEKHADRFSDNDLRELGAFLLALAHGCTV